MVNDSSVLRSFRNFQNIIRTCGTRLRLQEKCFCCNSFRNSLGFAKFASPLPNKYKSEANEDASTEEMRSKKNVTVLSNLSEVFQALASKVAIVLPDMLRQLMALVQEWLKSGLERAFITQNHLDLDHYIVELILTCTCIFYQFCM